MPELHSRFDELQRAQAHHPLLLLGAYVFDFLMIHPFQDGNGRTARLITLLLLYQSGHEVGRYISLERIINDTRSRPTTRRSNDRRSDGTMVNTTSGRGWST